MRAITGTIFALALLLKAQTELPKDVLQLAQLKRDVAASLTALNNYTCVETIQRSRRRSKRQEFQRVDIVHVEVAVAGNRELFSWPGANQFEERDVSEIVGAGMMSTGSFRSAIQSVLLDNVSTIRWRGEEQIHGHRALRWDYTIPYNLSGWEVQIYGYAGRVSESGSFWADAETLELLRLETTANDIPPDLRVTSIKNEIDYARTRVRSRDLLLPQSAEVLVADLKGVENRNRIEFSQCREFSGSSKLGFDPPVPVDIPAEPVPELQLPAGLEFTVQLAGAIDSKTASVGDKLTAIVQTPVRYRGTVLIPKGAVVEGRIRRLERETSPRPYYLMGLEFTGIEFGASHARFIAAMLGIQPVAGLSLDVGVPFQIPGVSTFFVEGTAFHLPEGLQMTWRTYRLGK